MCDRGEPRYDDKASRPVRFERWAKQTPCAGDVGGSYSRAAWLPVIGPTAWLVWGAVTEGLEDDGFLECSLADIGRPWGYAPEDASWALLQLARFGLALPGGDDRWRVTTFCPPLPDRLVPAALGPVQALHRRLGPPSRATGRNVRWTTYRELVLLRTRLGTSQITDSYDGPGKPT